MTETERPLAGKTVAVVHAAWHSCGSYQLNVAQAAAYRDLGAHVISYALREWPPGRAAAQRRAYFAHTADMPAHERFYGAMPTRALLRPRFWRDLYWPLIHGDHARATAAMIALAETPADLAGRAVDLVHCNHFFCLPAALALKGGGPAPIFLETQDVQARQYALRNESLWLVPPRASYASMLAQERAWLDKADVLIHLNADEDEAFRRLSPGARHALVYPAVAPPPTAPGGEAIVIVASGNLPNTLSVIWFLEEIAPRMRQAVTIVGTVAEAVAARAPALYARWRALFAGRVDDIAAVYARAGLVLLPTTEGHGLSIKTVEAMASGAPLIATRHAFRGMRLDPASLDNVRLADTPDAFVDALDQSARLIAAGAGVRGESATRRAYERYFSAEAYRRALWALAEPRLAGARTEGAP